MGWGGGLPSTTHTLNRKTRPVVRRFQGLRLVTGMGALTDAVGDGDGCARLCVPYHRFDLLYTRTHPGLLYIYTHHRYPLLTFIHTNTWVCARLHVPYHRLTCYTPPPTHPVYIYTPCMYVCIYIYIYILDTHTPHTPTHKHPPTHPHTHTHNTHSVGGPALGSGVPGN